MAFTSSYPARSTQHGMALIVVLWMLAALSLFAASLGMLVRDRASQALVQRQLTEGRAAGDAAILLALQQWQQKARRPGAETVHTNFAGDVIPVHFQPWAGLVNINHAPETVWTALLVGAAQVPRSQAQALAHTIVQQRQALAQTTRQGPWEAPQDLLAIPGIHYTLYYNLQPYLIASTDSRSTIVQDAAPVALRNWLQSMAPEQLQASNDNGRLYTVTAQVSVPEQGTVFVQRTLSWNRDDYTGLPWTLLAANTTWQPLLPPLPFFYCRNMRSSISCHG